jgi:hypothetical protein
MNISPYNKMTWEERLDVDVPDEDLQSPKSVQQYYNQHFAPIEVHSVILTIGVIMKHRCQLNHARTFY